MKALTKFFRAIRFQLYNLICWIVVVPMAMLVLLMWPFGHHRAYRIGRGWGLFCLWVVNHVCGLTYRIKWETPMPDETCVFMVKHSSAFETFGSLQMFPRVCWVLKKTLTYIPFFGWTLIALDGIAIDRNKGRAAVKQLIDQGKDRLARGISVIVYPEGTRMPAGETKRYGLGGVLLAQASGHKIVPVAHNAGYFWPRRTRHIVPGEISVVVGEPIDPTGRDPRELNEEIQAWIEANIEAPDYKL
jgi:1-acyl-sn-glycerol-3-phosphate acyltransferase